ncbi:MAG: transposase domain-containing protein [Pirellula sp.]|nr:transposase domain-containing protein [Pirellula sp.]
MVAAEERAEFFFGLAGVGGADCFVGFDNLSHLVVDFEAAMLMTLVSSAKRHHLDVWMYLKNVLDRMLSGETDYSRLVPDVWKADHPEAVREYRVAESRQK